MRKIICYTLIVCFAQISNAYSKPLTAEELYNFAKQKEVIQLENNSKYINITNTNNDTALCIAIKNNDKHSFELLKKYGANTEVDCLQKILKNTNKELFSNKNIFLGMGKTGWLTTGAVVAVAGGVAAAAGGGGGGGSNSSDNTNTPSVPSVPNCINGSLINDNCVCDEGWTGNTCEQTVNCPYNTTSCTDGYEETGNTCKSGNITYKECKAKDCSGFNYTSCPIGYSQSDFCLSGTETKIKCDNCAVGYVKDGSGNCIQAKQANIVGFTGSINNNSIDIENTDYADIYGIYNNSSTTTNSFADYNQKSANGSIIIKNYNDGNIYGIYTNSQATNSCIEGGGKHSSNGEINIINEGIGNIYGIYSSKGSTFNVRLSATNNIYEPIKPTGTITISNIGNGYIYGMFSEKNGYNALWEHTINDVNEMMFTDGKININNIGGGFVYGIYTIDNIYNANSLGSKGTLNITNKGSGNVYGLYSKNSSVYNSNRFADGIIKINNEGDGDIYGIYAINEAYNSTSDYYDTGEGHGKINIQNKGNGNVFGIYSLQTIHNATIGKISTSNLKGEINIENEGKGTVFGMYSKNIYNETEYTGTLSHGTNESNINILNKITGISVGMYTTGGEAINSGNIIIEGGDIAIGIYGESGSNITNTGTISINGAKTAYGIYAEDETVTISNTGTISIDGNTNHANAIKLNGGKLFQNGLLTANSLNLDNMDGEIVATSSSSFIAEDDISGDLSISNNVVKSGFDTTYTVDDMIKAGDSSKLNLVSKSAMFDASLKNGKDAVMTMKSFNDVVENKSLANFLQKNYAMQNNEKLFSNIKSAENIKSLNNFTDQMFGKDMFSRFAFEDLMIMRELNFDINNKLFNNKEDYLSIGGNKSSFAFSGNSRYSLTSNTVGDYSVGLSVAFSDINSDDGNKDNRRYDKMYNISMPIGYQANGLKFVSTPRVGYSYGTYERNGFNNQSYEGTVEKQMFAFMNEARYPIQIGGWNIAPSAELNFINYRISGHETDKEYSLKIKSQNNYSIEAGIGLYASKETKFTKDSLLRFNGGVALYHEFADPYKMKLGMEGMSGTFTLRDENRSDNRAVVQSEIEFKHNNFSIVGNIASYIDRKYETNTTLDFKFGF